ncbi:hypothetical protein [Tahibacter harae]|uniref:Tip attachment protein J domain-containing protein n=1 Tax=Tahibacter harae TaxID=2963937 RepID=A0ABT1QS90_9GAMM|nr:hypothetical protein [Tahibacter harae]MCQ4165144.1 hypothetical protein [Tahibacter harae]
MAIIATDLKFFQAERMTDFADGGGRITSVEIIDNAINNVFPDRSNLDAILGRVSLRKFFFQVHTANTDAYLGAFIFLTDPPDDPLVHVSLFDTADPDDERAAARGYVEAYRTQGTKSQFTLYGLHLAGQTTIQVYCRSEIASPDIGDVLCLSVEAAGYTPAQQFVRVQEVASRQTVTFEDAQGEFRRDVLLITITTPLGQAFVGQEDPARLTGVNPPPTRIRRTQVANAARYYTVMPLAAPADEGDLTIQIATPYISLVPSSQAETPLTDVRAGMPTVALVRSGALDSLTYAGTMTGAAGVEVVRYLGSPYMRRSLNISIGAVALRDDGSGGIVAVNPSDTGWSGTADYESGGFSVARDVGYSGAATVTATPAGAVAEQGFSLAVPITAANRQISYVQQLPNFPAPGTIYWDYRALGRWIRLSDNGAGLLTGGTGEGSATYNAATGSIAATLGALPDVDSALIVSWGTDNRARNSSGEITVPTPRYRQQLDHQGCMPGTLIMGWTTGGVAKSATANAAGVISGDASGSIEHNTSIVDFSLTAFPDAQITYSYDYADGGGVHIETFTPSPSGGAVTFTLAHPPQPGTVGAQWNVSYEANPTLVGLGRAINVAIGDDGVGGWIHTLAPGTGSIDYGDGECVITVEADVPAYLPQFGRAQNTATGGTGIYARTSTLADVGCKFATGTPIVVRYIEAGTAVVSTSEGHSLPAIRVYLGDGAAGPAVPGSVRFTFRGREYVDRGGSLVYDVSPLTNAGTVGGSYDYSSNTATITAIGAGSSNVVSIRSLLTRYFESGVSNMMFRTPGAPLRAGSFTVRATTMDGVLLTGSADINGIITGSQLKGVVDWETGVVQLSFGGLVTAAGNEGEPWYDAAYVVGGQIWKPRQVDPSSVYIGTVVYRSIPADPAIIGIDPVRLPLDGRVPAYQAGGVLVIHHTQVTSVATPVAGATEDLGREQIGTIEVFDSAGTPIVDTWYDIDLTAGTLTWSDPLNLSAYTLPAIIRDRIEQAVQCSDVQITGELGLQAPLARDFPAGTMVSSAIAVGDMQARYTGLFDQQTYVPGQWLDVVAGAPAAASYNDAVYPIAVNNRAAIDQRWAVVFTAPTTVNVIGETAGQVLSGVSITGDIAPVNPVTGTPYFTIDADGWGGGWAAGNVLRFNTVSATKPIWAARTTLQGEITELTDSVRIQAFGNAH